MIKKITLILSVLFFSLTLSSCSILDLNKNFDFTISIEDLIGNFIPTEKSLVGKVYSFDYLDISMIPDTDVEQDYISEYAHINYVYIKTLEFVDENTVYVYLWTGAKHACVYSYDSETVTISGDLINMTFVVENDMLIQDISSWDGVFLFNCNRVNIIYTEI